MQQKPMWIGFKKGQRIYGIRSIGAITSYVERPFYRGWYYLNAKNTAHLWDKEGRYMRKSYGWRRLSAKERFT